MTRSAAEIRDYLRRQVNQALRRLGMYGDETSLILLFDSLAYADGTDGPWQQERETLRQRRAFCSTGVRGELQDLFPSVGRGEGAIASVYAEFAHRVGWLDLDRILNHAEYATLVEQRTVWSDRDTSLSDVERQFGPPSVLLGGTNPGFPKTLLYAGSSEQPVVCFHFWNLFNGTGFAYPEPALLATRLGNQPFPHAFRFTPEGQQLRPGKPAPGEILSTEVTPLR